MNWKRKKLKKNFIRRTDMKKIKENELPKYLDTKYKPFVSDDALTHFRKEKSLIKRLKKHKGKSVYLKFYLTLIFYSL